MAATVDLREKAMRRWRYENRTGQVHLRGGRRQKVKHTKGHGRGRPVPKFDGRKVHG